MFGFSFCCCFRFVCIVLNQNKITEHTFVVVQKTGKETFEKYKLLLVTVCKLFVEFFRKRNENEKKNTHLHFF